MIRFCVKCGGEIAAERIAKNPKKVRFCGDGCRSADRHELSELQRRKRRSRLKQPSCEAVFPYLPLEGASAHVHEISQEVSDHAS